MLNIETNEKETLDLLKTHYYKTSYENIKEVYLNALPKLGFQVISIDDDYYEIYAVKGRMSVLAKIIEQNLKETSIDFFINAEYLFGNRKKAFTFISTIYQILEKKFAFKGLGLHQ